jgi:oligopeptidase B
MIPIAKRIPKELTIHNDTRIDEYYWMNERENPDVVAYLNEENAYTAATMASHKDLEETIYQEIIGRIAPTDMSVPYFDNGYWYFTRFEEGKEYPIYSRKKVSLEAAEEILLDVNILAEGHAYFQVGGMSISPDNQWLVYGVDKVSRRQYTLHFKNLITGETLDKTIPNTTGGATWANDSQHLFYTWKDKTTLRSCRVFRHNIQNKSNASTLVFEELDETFICSAGKSKSRNYILIGSYSTVSTEFLYLDANNPKGKFEVIEPRRRDHEYSVEHYGDAFYIVSNWEAKNFRLLKTPVTATTQENWQEVIAHREDVLLESIEIFKDFLVLSERAKGITQLRVKAWSGDADYYISLGEEAFCIYPSVNPEFDTTTLRFGYTSMCVPNSVYDYDMLSQKETLLKQQIIVGGYESSDYQSERLFATADDGTKIPISLVYKKGLTQNGKNPTLLYAYGSYGHSMDPYFSQSRLSLLDRGWVFAIAHIRGGQEMGRYWYEEGKLLQKKNTFTDFIACAATLIAEKYTDNQHLAAMGGSAGGLLMGAVMNLRPDLFKAIVAAVPFVDVVTTMLDDSIPLTTGEYDEWGNPNDPTYYHYMKSYSPYDNVAAKDYPNVLVTTGFHDSQVQYWEPAKWVARLRALKTDNNTLLLHCNMDTGHGGASGRYEMFKEVAMEYAFLLKFVLNN